MNNLVTAIRHDEKVGEGSCTTIDETYTDEDLKTELEQAGVTTAKDAVRWARQREGMQIENATNKRFGEDGDSEIAELREWDKS